jgi:hypothetical protein
MTRVRLAKHDNTTRSHRRNLYARLSIQYQQMQSDPIFSWCAALALLCSAQGLRNEQSVQIRQAINHKYNDLPWLRRDDPDLQPLMDIKRLKTFKSSA